MYDLTRRINISLVVPGILTLVFITRIISNNYFKTVSPSTLVLSSLYFALELAVGFLLSVFFFSIETIIRNYITDSDAPESLRFKAEIAKLPFVLKVKRILQADRLNTERKITRSVVFQVALIIFAIFAMTSSSGVVGVTATLSILLQMATDQVMLLRQKRDASVWFWQIKTNVQYNIQIVYISAVSIVSALFIISLIK